MGPCAVGLVRMIRVHVHPQHQEDGVTTYTFPLQDPTTNNVGGDTTLVLDPEALHLQENAVLVVTCELMFRPHTSLSVDGWSGDECEDEAAFALLIPVGAPRQLLLVQLGQPVNEHASVTAASPGRRSIESSRYASRYASSDEKSSGHSVVPWWSALASHAEYDESFASIWSKVSRVAAEQNQEASRTSLTKLTSPSRFSVTVPSALPAGETDQRESARIEHMLRFLGQVLPTMDASVLRRSCRVVHGGKLWLTLRTLAGNLLLLKLQPHGSAGALSIVIQCSDAGELSAVRLLFAQGSAYCIASAVRGVLTSPCMDVSCYQMRALVLETMTEMETQVKHYPHLVNCACARLSVVLGSHMDAIVGLEALIQVREQLSSITCGGGLYPCYFDYGVLISFH